MTIYILEVLTTTVSDDIMRASNNSGGLLFPFLFLLTDVGVADILFAVETIIDDFSPHKAHAAILARPKVMVAVLAEAPLERCRYRNLVFRR